MRNLTGKPLTEAMLQSFKGSAPPPFEASVQSLMRGSKSLRVCLIYFTGLSRQSISTPR